tara:strand:- start:5842 stop:6273 length:432 start_codon:yes stop_codon:yes gene_type:complete
MIKRLIFIILIGINDAFVINTNVAYNQLLSHKHLQSNVMRSDIKLIDNKYTVFDKILDVTVKDKYVGKIIVEQISSILPRVDTIGHSILHANNEFIDYILNDTNYSEIMKKNIVLASIKLAIMGDNFGSHLLQLYYDIVDKCL